jgi:hypothetical protein
MYEPTPPAGRLRQVGSDRGLRLRRRGTVIVVAAVFLFLATFLTVRLATTMTGEHRRMRQHERQLQSVWLAESGIERAVAQLQLNPNYEGEMWTRAAEATGQSFDGVVEIRIDRVGAAGPQRQVSVVADYPAELPHRVRYAKTVAVDVTNPGGSS